MKPIFQAIANSLYSVDIINESTNKHDRVGTSFAISDTTFLTATHLLGSIEEKFSVKLVPLKGRDIPVEIERMDSTSDLTLLKTDNENTEIIPIDAEVASIIPEPGSMCIWGGFSKLIGETSSRRVRFGKGMVCSLPYGRKSKSVFDIDGNFNPGHSGSPILDYNSGKLVGVVSRSAGEPVEVFKEALLYSSALVSLSTAMAESMSMEELTSIMDTGDLLKNGPKYMPFLLDRSHKKKILEI
ncbi:MAG: S1 family peptidase [Candidatus Thorarchaeota archaeon]